MRLSPIYANTASGLETRERGEIYNNASGFKVFESNNIPSGYIFAMARGAVHFAQAFIEMDVRQEPEALTDNLLMEWVYGTKVFSTNAKSIVTKQFTLA